VSSRTPQDADMLNQLVSSNHSPHHNANHRSTVDPITRAHFAAGDLLQALGIEQFFLATCDSVRQLSADLIELHRIRALADERILRGAAQANNADDAPRLWDVAKMAKQLGLARDVVRRSARRWAFTLCITHNGCRGGRRSCDIRFIASEAAAWINKQRKVRR
jgi:hypothetical protein